MGNNRGKKGGEKFGTGGQGRREKVKEKKGGGICANACVGVFLVVEFFVVVVVGLACDTCQVSFLLRPFFCI